MNNIPKIKLNVDDTFLGRDNDHGAVSVPENNEKKNPTQPDIDPFSEPKVNVHVGSETKNYAKDKNINTNMFKKILKSKIFVFIIVLLFVFIAVLGYFSFVSYNFYKQAIITKDSVKTLSVAISSKNLDEVNVKLTEVESNLKMLERKYKLYLVFKPFPYIGGYISDGEHALLASKQGVDLVKLLIKTTEPYSDFLGFSSSKIIPKNEGETAKDKIDFVIKTIPDLLKQVDEINSKTIEVKKNLDQIDPYKYPEKIGDTVVRENLVKALELVDMATEFIINGRPLLENAEDLLGVNEPKTYLVLFQNDKELRPTGGFITAYTIAKVTKGRFEPGDSSDIYNLDEKYTPSVTAPDPIIKYLKGPYVLSRKLKLRDMNWSPDFYESMKLFSKEVEKAGVKKIDGIISVDTQLLVYLLEVLGEVPVAGYGNFSTKNEPKCDCPQVIYELESFADVEGPIVWSENTGEIVFAPENYDNRKKIIGPLMNAILSSTLGLPNEKFPALFEAAMKSINEKHILFYMSDEVSQKAIESFDLGGRIDRDFEGDYLHINDANLGGRKSNLYVTQEVNQEVNIKKDGTIEKTLTITYKNPQKYDGWLNSVLPNWVRIYVPKGSKLIDIQGLEEQADTYEEFGKTVFAGYFQLRPLGAVVLTLKYEVPLKFSEEYNLLIQKQPGTNTPMYITKVGKSEEEFYLTTDKELKIKL